MVSEETPLESIVALSVPFVVALNMSSSEFFSHSHLVSLSSSEITEWD
jgi:hypothetical protein